jgi:hypothetical protein
LILSNTSSFLTWSVQLIFSIILQHHISKLSRCFWSTACYSMHNEMVLGRRGSLLAYYLVVAICMNKSI